MTAAVKQGSFNSRLNTIRAMVGNFENFRHPLSPFLANELLQLVISFQRTVRYVNIN